MNKVTVVTWDHTNPEQDVITTYESEKVMLGAMDGALMITQEHDSYEQETIVIPMSRVIEAKFYVGKKDGNDDNSPKLAVV